MNDGASVPGGYLLHSYEARSLAARLATAHTLAIGVVIALIAWDTNHFDRVTIGFMIALAIWAPIIPMIPWGRHSHNWVAKLYLLGVAMFVFFAFHFDNPYLLLGVYPELIALADVYWYRRSLVALHLGGVLAVFIGGALIIDGSAAAALVLIAAPLMLASALLVGALSHRFIQSFLQHSQFRSAVDALLAALHARDGYTGDHSKVTLAVTRTVAHELDLDDDARAELADVALLHDIGKLGIPNSILQKPGALTDEEWLIMRRHPVIGEEILAGVPGFEAVALAVRHEHERWDGGGYPDGLAGSDIPLPSRIVFACDAVHAMTSDRPYRAAMELSEARAELRKHSGSQFDPQVVEAFDRAVESGAYADATMIEVPPAQLAPDAIHDAPADGPFEFTGSEEKNPNNEITLNDPAAMIVVAGVSALLAALVMSAYLLVQGPFDWVGLAFIAVALAIAAVSFVLHDSAPRSWSIATAFLAYLFVPLVALHFNQPAMMTFLLGGAVMLSGFFWLRLGPRIFQICLLFFEFVVVPVILFGGEMFTFAVVSARAFPGALLIVGYFTMGLAEMRFERARFSGTMSSLLLALQARDGYTADHSRETVAMALQVGEVLGIDGSAILELKDVALLHDIGKLGIPDEILNKPGPLTADEWHVMRRHPVIGEKIIRRVPGFDSVALAIRHEHERWDGDGYPDGVAGNVIPLSSRIVFACDAFHAMTSDRPYRKSLGLDVARAEMVRNAGTQFDPTVVIALLDVLDRLEEQLRGPKQTLLAA